MFTKAVRKKSYFRGGLTGPSGAGKTWGALQIAKGLGGKTAVIDTETGSASMYSHLLDFDVLELAPPYAPERFIEAIEAAVAGGYNNIIIDSITHEWSGSGGCLEINDATAAAEFRGNPWSAWSKTTPRHRKFIDALMRAPAHVIVTMRSKTETAQEKGANGRSSVVKLGMKTEQRDGIEYELTLVLDIVHAGHFALASKDRTGLFAGQIDPTPITEATGKRLLEWLNSGAEPAPEPVQLTQAQTLLVFLNDAAKVGSAELKRAYNDLKSAPVFASVWSVESARLKQEAAEADEYHAKEAA